MPKALKIALSALGIVIVLIIGVATALSLLIDPNDYRDTIAGKVEEATGRSFALGEIELKVFPWVKLRVNDAALGNAEGFGDTPFAAMEEVDVAVKVIPMLFHRQLIVSDITLTGMRLNLAVDADGRNNWDDLAGADSKAEEQPDAPSDGEPLDLSQIDIGSVSIRDAAIRYHDRQDGQRVAIENFSLQTGRLRAGEPFDLSTGAKITLDDPQAMVDWTFSGRLAPDADFTRIAAENLKLRAAVELRASPLADGKDVRGQLSLDGSVLAQLNDQQIDINQLVLGIETGSSAYPYGLGIAGKVQLSGNPRLQLADSTLAWPDLRVNFDVQHREGSAKGAVGSPITLNWDTMKLALAELALDAEARSAQLNKPLKIAVRAAVDYDGTAHTAAVEGLSLSASDLKLTGALRASRLDSDAPQAQGKIAVAAFSPRALAAELGIDLPPMQDPKALGKLQLNADFTGSTTRGALRNLVLVLDDTTARGTAELRDLASQSVRFDLNVDQIDVDRYLPPAEDAPKDKKADDGGALGDINQIALPTEMLDALNVDGVLAIGTLKASGLTLSDARVTLSGGAGQPKQQRVTAKLYGGNIALDHRYTPGSTPGWNLKAGLDAFQAAPFLKDFLGDDFVSGLTRFDIDLTTRGSTVGDLRAALNGQLSASVRDGAIKGFNLGAALRRAEAAFTGNMAAARAPATVETTDFSALSVAAKITNGVLETTLLDAASPLFRLEGGGKINLINETIDFLAKPTVVATATGQGGKELEALRGLTIPIALSGSLFDPRVRFDFKEALKNRALDGARERLQVEEGEIRERVKAEERRARDKVESKIEKELGEGASEALRGLFGRSRATPTAAPEASPTATPEPAATEAESAP